MDSLLSLMTWFLASSAEAGYDGLLREGWGPGRWFLLLVVVSCLLCVIAVMKMIKHL